MGKVKTPKKAKKSKSGVVSSLASGAIGSLLGGGSSKGTGKRHSRRNSPEYWAKKVLVAKLKKKYFKVQYGGR